jgi:hypothetical protein
MLVLRSLCQRITGFVRTFILGMDCLLIAATCARAAAPPGTVQRDDRIGVCTHFSQNWPVGEVMPLIARSGAAWVRDDLNWADLEPAPEKYQIPSKARAWIQAAKQMGLKIDLILAYGNPAYADHYDTDAYAKAAGWLARELAHDIQAIEILNEPNNFGFRDTYGGEWNGNEPNGSVSPYLRKYVELLNAAAKEIKLANPHMTVIGLGTPAPASFRMIALGLAPQVDGLTDHPYAGSLPELIPYPASPDFLQRDGIATADATGTLASQVSMFRAQARKWGATDKLWHTEWGYATLPAKEGVSEETQAVYILRRLLESAAIGVEHTFIYDFKDDGENFGLVKNDLSPKKSYLALQKITGLLAGMGTVSSAKQARIENDPALKPEGLGYRCHTFSSSDEQRTVVAFWEAKPWDPNANTTNAVVTLPLVREPRVVFLYDALSGNQKEIPWQWSGEDHSISATAPISGAPKLIICQSAGRQSAGRTAKTP